MNSITVVEDDAYFREELIRTFEKSGFSASGLSSFESPEQDILKSAPDLVLLDINLPGKSGFVLCRWLKSRTTIPVLVLTSRDAMRDELRAIELGADDYLTKPCHPKRLIARTQRLLQTYGKLRNLLQAGEITLDSDTGKVIFRDASVVLPETERKIWRLLLERYPAAVSKEELFAQVWGGSDYVDANILQVNMTRLRNSLSAIGLKNAVETVRGYGYRLGVASE